MKSKEDIEQRIKEIDFLLKHRVYSIREGALYLDLYHLIKDRISVDQLKANRATLSWVIDLEDDF